MSLCLWGRTSFYDALETNVAISKFKMSAGATSIVEPEEPGDLWSSEETWHIAIDISSLDTMVNDLELEVSAAVGRAQGVLWKLMWRSPSSRCLLV